MQNLRTENYMIAWVGRLRFMRQGLAPGVFRSLELNYEFYDRGCGSRRLVLSFHGCWPRSTYGQSSPSSSKPKPQTRIFQRMHRRIAW